MNFMGNATSKVFELVSPGRNIGSSSIGDLLFGARLIVYVFVRVLVFALPQTQLFFLVVVWPGNISALVQYDFK